MDKITHLPPRPALRLVDAAARSAAPVPDAAYVIGNLVKAIEFSAHAQSDMASLLCRINGGQPLSPSADILDDIAIAHLLQAAVHGFALRGARNAEKALADVLRHWLHTHGFPQ